MLRITLVEAENAPPEVKEIYVQKLKGHPGNVHKALAHRPEMLKSFLPLLRLGEPLAGSQALRDDLPPSVETSFADSDSYNS